MFPGAHYAARTGRLDSATPTAVVIPMMTAAPHSGQAHSGHSPSGTSGHSPATAWICSKGWSPPHPGQLPCGWLMVAPCEFIFDRSDPGTHDHSKGGSRAACLHFLGGANQPPRPPPAGLLAVH